MGSTQHTNYPNRWAAYFVGAGFHSAGVWQSSDAMLKQNVTDLTDATDILAQLQPKRYQFRTGDYPHLGLPEGTHDGIMAGDLQAVLPGLVRTVTHPAQYDTLGNMLQSAVTFKAVNYGGLIRCWSGPATNKAHRWPLCKIRSHSSNNNSPPCNKTSRRAAPHRRCGSTRHEPRRRSRGKRNPAHRPLRSAQPGGGPHAVALHRGHAGPHAPGGERQQRQAAGGAGGGRA
ncbi:MAG: tail fiber domain-containing protein [Flavobacteriales bacterium]|nr:tail fiber domain-containing protein [Flavobacteriales bacterium]